MYGEVVRSSWECHSRGRTWLQTTGDGGRNSQGQPPGLSDRSGPSKIYHEDTMSSGQAAARLPHRCPGQTPAVPFGVHFVCRSFIAVLKANFKNIGPTTLKMKEETLLSKTRQRNETSIYPQRGELLSSWTTDQHEHDLYRSRVSDVILPRMWYIRWRRFR